MITEYHELKISSEVLHQAADDGEIDFVSSLRLRAMLLLGVPPPLDPYSSD